MNGSFNIGEWVTKIGASVGFATVIVEVTPTVTELVQILYIISNNLDASGAKRTNILN